MHRPFTLVTPDRLRIREGGGCMALFGLPFFGAGVVLFLNLFGIVPISNADDGSTLVGPLLALMAIAFTTVGGALVFGRVWTIVDREQHEVTRQWGALTFPLHQRTTPMHGYTVVRLGFVEGDSDTADQYPVALKGPIGADLVLWNATVYEQARECAMAVAELLRLEVEDASTDHPARLPPGQLNTTLRERLRNAGDVHVDVARPPDARSTVTREAGSVTVEIPVRRTHWLFAAAGIIPLTILYYIGPGLLTFFKQSQTPDPVTWIFMGFLTLFFGVLPTMTIINGVLRSRRGATIVEASRQGLRVRERRAWTTRTIASVDSSDILDIDYSSREARLASAKRAAEQQVLQSHASPSEMSSPRVERIVVGLTRFARNNGVTVKTRQGLTTFGKGLDDEEIRYLHSVVRRALVE